MVLETYKKQKKDTTLVHECNIRFYLHFTLPVGYQHPTLSIQEDKSIREITMECKAAVMILSLRGPCSSILRRPRQCPPRHKNAAGAPVSREAARMPRGLEISRGALGHQLELLGLREAL